MVILLGWLAFSFVVAILAGNRGRNGVAWFFISLVTSPLLAGAFILVMEDLSLNETPSNSNPTGSDHHAGPSASKPPGSALTPEGIEASLNKADKLLKSEMITSDEFLAKKKNVLDQMSSSTLSGEKDDFLLALANAVETEILTKAEAVELKKTISDSFDRSVTAAALPCEQSYWGEVCKVMDNGKEFWVDLSSVPGNITVGAYIHEAANVQVKMNSRVKVRKLANNTFAITDISTRQFKTAV